MGDGAAPADVVEFNRRFAQRLSSFRGIHTTHLDDERARREAGEGVFGEYRIVQTAREQVINGRSGDISVRIIEAKEPRGVYLHFHGGGWVFGAAHHYDEQNLFLAENCNLTTMSVNYRLAPENPFPAAPDDCEDVACWLIEEGAQSLNAERLYIGGDSAGAHLAVMTLLKARDRYRRMPFSAANLLYGFYDLALSPSARAWGELNLPLSTESLEWYAQQFAGGRPLSDKALSPIHADLTGMPPAIFTVGTLDPLLDDTFLMAGRWISAGGRASILPVAGGVHGFMQVNDLSITSQTQRAVCEFLNHS